MKEFPSVNVRVEYRRANLIYEDVLQGAVDMGLSGLPEKMKGVDIIPFAKSALVAPTRITTFKTYIIEVSEPRLPCHWIRQGYPSRRR